MFINPLAILFSGQANARVIAKMLLAFLSAEPGQMRRT